MEVTPAANAPSATPPPAAASATPPSSEQTPAAAASTPPAVGVSANGTPGAAPAKPVVEGAPKWTDGFDADTQEYVKTKGFQDSKSVIDSYRNLEKLRGVPADRLLKLPEAGDEKGMKELYQKLGTPATPEGYGLTSKDPNKPEFTNWATKTFHDLNLTAEQGQQLATKFNEHIATIEANENAAHTNAVKTQTETLKKEWGGAYNQNVMRAQMAYRQLGIPDAAIDSLERSIGFDGVMKMFEGLASKFGEHSFVDGNPQQGFGEGAILTPEQANAKIKALKADTNWAERYVKGGVKEKAEMERLHKMANP